MHQQSKLGWTEFDYQCNKLFFCQVKHKRVHTFVFSLMENKGHRVDGFEGVVEIFSEYHKRLLGKQTSRRRRVDLYRLGMGAIIAIEQQIELCKPINGMEMREAIFSIPNSKSPGPDGYFS